MKKVPHLRKLKRYGGGCSRAASPLEIEVHTDTVPGRSLSVELPIRGGAYVILCEELNLPVSDARIFELDACHDRVSDLPICAFVALEIPIRDRPKPTAEKRAGADEFYPPLRRPSSQILGEAMHDVSASSIHPQPREQLVGQFYVEFLIAEIDA